MGDLCNLSLFLYHLRQHTAFSLTSGGQFNKSFCLLRVGIGPPQIAIGWIERRRSSEHLLPLLNSAEMSILRANYGCCDAAKDIEM